MRKKVVRKKLRSVILKGNKYYPIDLPAGFDGNTKRSKRYCSSETAAKELKSEISHWKLTRKLKPDTLVLAETDRQWITYLHAELGPDLSALPAIIGHWRKTAVQLRAPCTVSQLVEQFLTYRASRPGSKRTLADMRHRAKRFAALFSDIQAHEVAPAQIREFLDSSTYPRNDFKVASVMFGFARERGMVVIDPIAEIKRPDASHTEPGIYQPEDFKRLLETAEKNFPDVLPFLLFSGFAGCRSSELVSMYAGEATLQWADVLWDRKLISIPPAVAKKTKSRSGDRRYIPMLPALIDWLAPHRKDAGPIVPYAESWLRKIFRGHKAKPEDGDSPDDFGLFRLAGVAPVKNGLRHSFASYWLAANHGKEGVGRLAVIMGNSEAVARQHYLEILQPRDGKAWFGIRREALKNKRDDNKKWIEAKYPEKNGV